MNIYIYIYKKAIISPNSQLGFPPFISPKCSK